MLLCLSRVLPDDYSTTHGDDTTLGTRIDRDRSLRRPDEKQRLAAFLDRTRPNRLQDVNVRVDALVDVETGVAERIGDLDERLLEHLRDEHDEVGRGRTRAVRDDLAHFARVYRAAQIARTDAFARAQTRVQTERVDLQISLEKAHQVLSVDFSITHFGLNYGLFKEQAKRHDAVVVVYGAFEQEIQRLYNLLADYIMLVC